VLRSVNRTNVVAGIVCFAFAAFVYWIAGGIPAVTATDNLGGRFFPRMISVGLMIASLGLIVTGLLGMEISGGTARGGKPPADEAAPEPRDQGARFGPGEVRLVAFVAVLIAYTLALPNLGYVASSLIAFAAMIAIIGERRPLQVILGSVGITALLYFVFAIVFAMNLPRGSLF
jgi:putative tricarboxylic transport membrane protein